MEQKPSHSPICGRFGGRTSAPQLEHELVTSDDPSPLTDVLPSSTQCRNDVVTTSSRRHYNANDVVTTSSQRFAILGLRRPGSQLLAELKPILLFYLLVFVFTYWYSQVVFTYWYSFS